jgi:uncharacterized oligopeptide transporter (OPT) family protein
MNDKKSSQERGIEKIQEFMVDTKFDGLRTAGAKRALVFLGCFTIAAATLLYWFEASLFLGAGLIGVGLVFLAWWLLRVSTRLVADAPDEALDEFQVRQRDRTYLDAYRALGAVVTVLAGVLMAVVISTDAVTVGNVDRYQLTFDFGQVTGVIWFCLSATMLIPNLVLAWNQAKKGL